MEFACEDTNVDISDDFQQSHYSFFPEDDELWLRHLEEHGYCVLRGVVDESVVSQATTLLWSDMDRYFGAKREDYLTWGNIPTGAAGIVNRMLPQTLGAWMIRGHEAVRTAFGKIWQTDNLLVSMDSLLIWLPWWLVPSWMPYSEGLHIDQNPFTKPNRCCVQGMVPLQDVTEATGGLEVVPGSHLPEAKERFKKNHMHCKQSVSDWCVLRIKSPEDENPLLLKAKAGDLILWDSRLLHGGKVGTGAMHEEVLARLTVTVCMTPRSFISPGREKLVLDAREKGFISGSTFSHWPHEIVRTFWPRESESAQRSPPALPERVKDLIF